MTSVTVSRGDVLAPSVQSRRGSIRQGAPQQAWTCASVPLGGGLCRPWGVGALGGGAPTWPAGTREGRGGQLSGVPLWRGGDGPQLPSSSSPGPGRRPNSFSKDSGSHPEHLG